MARRDEYLNKLKAQQVAADRLMDLIYGPDEWLLEYILPGAWPTMIHESYEELGAKDYPVPGRMGRNTDG
jgi:hypothetical protein